MNGNLILWWSADRTFATYSYLGIYPSTNLVCANIVDAGYIDDEKPIIDSETIGGRLIKLSKARRFIELSIPIFYEMVNSGVALQIESFIHAPYKRIFIKTSDFPGQDVLAAFINENTINLVRDKKSIEDFNSQRKNKLYKITLLEEDSHYI
jgi:hypothetical protein